MTNTYNLTATTIYRLGSSGLEEFDAFCLSHGNKDLFAMTDPKMAADTLMFLYDSEAEPQETSLRNILDAAAEAIKARWQFSWQQVVPLSAARRLGVEITGSTECEKQAG